MQLSGCEEKNKFTVSGGDGEGVPPVPIPNTEVKPHRAESTWRATAWQDRSSPGFFYALIYTVSVAARSFCARVSV